MGPGRFVGTRTHLPLPPATRPNPPIPLRESRVLALLGLLTGSGLVVSGWVADTLVRGLPLGFDSLVTLHASNPLHWLLDMAPLAMALYGWSYGALHEKLAAAPHRALDLPLHVMTWTSEALLVVDRRGRIVAHTPSAARLFGWDGTALQGQRADRVLVAFFDGENRPRPRRDPDGEIAALQWVGRGRRWDGRAFPATVMSLPGAAPAGLRVLSVRDTSEEIAVTRERDRLREELSPRQVEAPERDHGRREEDEDAA